ncbi:MAG: GGDEF domain-containing protein [Nevskiaceae bacterium]|nr:MAG: GGDEF domain-containing protein [Nevskiaceae bacterium]
MSVPSPTLKIYRRLIRRLPAAELQGRLSSAALGVLSLPVLCLLFYAIGRQPGLLGAALLATLALLPCGLLLHALLGHLLAPLQMTLLALRTYHRERIVMPIPTDLDGETGELMRQVRKLMEANRDLARGIQELSACDPLTGLPGRRSADEYLRLALSLAERSEQTFCIALLELHRHDTVRERFGHDAARRGLSLCGEFLRIRLKRRSDWVGRWSDYGFIAVMISDPHNAVDYLEDLSRDFAHQMRGFEGVGLRLDIGLTDLRSGDTSATCLARVQIALLAAGDEDRGRVVAHMPATLAAGAGDDERLSDALRARALIP